MTVSQLIAYLQQCDPNLLVFYSEAEVEYPCEFITLDFVLAEIESNEG